MEEPQTQTSMVWYNYNPDEGVITSDSPVQVEISGDIVRHINQYDINSLNSSSTQEIDEVNESRSKSMKVTKVRGSNVERVPCIHCGKTFSCNANLRDHIRLHTGERPFSCSECGMAFAQRSNWRLHKRVHTGEKPYMCGICGKTFARSSHLPGHMRVHTGERPFACDSCNQSFTSGQALKNHMRTHTGEKPFICEYCLTPFTHSSSLSSHKKRCTGEKRKRGRPLGMTGHCIVKKKAANRPRGRPKKCRRKSKKLSQGEDDRPTPETENLKTLVIAGEGCSIASENDSKFKNCKLSIMKNLVEISVEVIEPHLIKNENISTGTPANENKYILGLKDDFTVDQKNSVIEDVANVAASTVYSDNVTDLHQEAAITMARLQRGTLNTIDNS